MQEGAEASGNAEIETKNITEETIKIVEKEIICYN
jgi:hypothetical protein